VATTTSASNGISWESPRVSGVQVKYQKFYGENLNKSVAPNDKFYSGNSGDGNSYRLDYTQGPLSIGTSAQKTSGGTNAVVATTGGAAMIPGEYKVATTYAKYNFGPFTAGLSTVKENLVVANAQENKTTLIGLSYPVSGKVTINATMASSERSAAGTVDAKGKQTGLQALYALSKRTDLYANYASTTNGLGKAYGIGNGSGRLAAVDNNLDKSTAYQIGMRHSF
jgi:predicted porin